jgi:hypothetical protein
MEFPAGVLTPQTFIFENFLFLHLHMHPRGSSTCTVIMPELAVYNYFKHFIRFYKFPDRYPGQFENLNVTSARICTILRDVKVYNYNRYFHAKRYSRFFHITTN